MYIYTYMYMYIRMYVFIYIYIYVNLYIHVSSFQIEKLTFLTIRHRPNSKINESDFSTTILGST